ncbi:hypothetical protein WH47_07990 [Habropoda laboriosa]|uniref:RGS domain-containing protein n=1 Tax=Habropoda laboriosa TaxID=597456 RepID=A0A0L7QPZ3_9HYME|nr:PREDICTED: uncharacterized protein LOC108576655 [Habropoda laboriosa]XP_017795182.1 PREDICTED: uncharacterized protein LOC108576655 [Habropoda laboriosa]KOC60629.1 hypothetical protein WH47_07990 [Habropoda laboriosa]
MQTSVSKKIGCIGKCISGLSLEQLDQLTDNINNTLIDSQGRKIFQKYLERRDLTDHLECLELYETCYEIINEATDESSRREYPLETLIENVKRVKRMVEALDGVSLLDMALLARYNEVLRERCRNELLIVLVDTRDRCRDHLRRVHDNFKKYASEPCPMTKN